MMQIPSAGVETARAVLMGSRWRHWANRAETAGFCTGFPYRIGAFDYILIGLLMWQAQCIVYPGLGFRRVQLASI